MDESVLWALALGLGGLGFLLLAVAGGAAMLQNTRSRGPGDVSRGRGYPPGADPAKESVSQAEEVSPPPASQPQTQSSNAERSQGTGGFLVWFKAWVFALLHAGTVSVVLGGMTFFEDLANASDEIRRTGTVTFPKQLLPGSLLGSISRKQVAQSSGGLLKDGADVADDQRSEGREEYIDPGELDPSTDPSSDSAEWEVVEPTTRT